MKSKLHIKLFYIAQTYKYKINNVKCENKHLKIVLVFYGNQYVS